MKRGRRISVARLVALAGGGILWISATLHAQQLIDPMRDCVKATHNPHDLVAETDVRIRNECGVPLHVYWGFYDADKDQGYVNYEVDLQPGQAIQPPYGTFASFIRAFGCPAAPIAGHPNGYTVVSRANPAVVVKQYDKFSSLACAPSPEPQRQPYDPRYWQPH
jgi:hypothetical protein